MWAIKFLSGSLAGREIRLQKGLVVLGKDSSCQIPIPDPGISKRHAQITVREQSLLIEDMDSRNGLFVDGKQIYSRSLKEGDRAGLGNVIFEVRRKEAQAPAFNHPYMTPYPSSPPPAPGADGSAPPSPPKGKDNITGVQNKFKKIFARCGFAGNL